MGDGVFERTSLPSGWDMPEGTLKAHYFVKGLSVCGRWASFSDTPEDANPSERCKACQRNLAAFAKARGGMRERSQ